MAENEITFRLGVGDTVPAPVDDTLSIQGMAADAKAVGDQLALKASKRELNDMGERVAALEAGSATKEELDALDERVADLEYKPMSIGSFDVSPKQAEHGSTLTAVALSYIMNKVPQSASLDGIPQAITQPSGTIIQPGSIAADRTWTLRAQDERGAIASKSAGLAFLWMAYYGAAAVPGSINSAFLLGLSGVLATGRARMFSANAGENQYIWYAVPASFGACTFKVGGFEGGFSKVSTFSHTNASGGVTDYDVYRSDNANLGNTTVTVS